MESASKRRHHDVTVIGAGWSGVTATKYMLEEGLTVVTLERRDGLGGLWYYSDDPTEKSVMKSTRTTSSATVSEMSDYPMPEGIEFPHHQQVLQYLQSYSSFFHVLPRIVFNTTVTSAEKRDGLWHVTTVNGDIYTSRFLVVCTGQTVPVTGPKDTIFKDFTGSVYHAKEIKEPLAVYRGKRLLIYGGGETAADICSDWFNHSSTIYWSVPRGQHFFRRYNKILPWKKPQALDKASSWLLTKIAPYHYSKPGLAWICKWTTSGSLLAYQGHGIPEWRNGTPFMHQFINKNGHILDLVDYKRVIPKGTITACSGKEIKFADGSSSEFDIVILSTGYKESFSFLPQERRPQNFLKLHKNVLDNDEPSLAFVGYIRPVIGSMFGIIEMQSRWLAKINSGRTPLKPKAKRLNETKTDESYWQEYFKTTVQPRDKIVEALIYVNDLGTQAGIYPNRWDLFNRSIYGWYVSLVAPYNGALFRLNEEEHRAQAIATLDRHRIGTTSPLHLLLLLFLRITFFDSFLYCLEYIKYKLQCFGIGRLLCKVPPVRFINRVWCLPKKYLFDNKTVLPPIDIKAQQ